MRTIKDRTMRLENLEAFAKLLFITDKQEWIKAYRIATRDSDMLASRQCKEVLETDAERKARHHKHYLENKAMYLKHNTYYKEKRRKECQTVE